MPTQTDPRVLILTGPPGAGKTTTAELLAARSDPAVHLEADLFFSRDPALVPRSAPGCARRGRLRGRLRGPAASAADLRSTDEAADTVARLLAAGKLTL